MKDDVPRRVAGAMPHLERELADLDLVAVVQPAARFEGAADDPVFGAVGAQLLDPEAILFVRALDRDAQLFGENPGSPAMIDVAVGQQDLLERHAGLVGRGLEPGQVAARIDERAAHCRGAPQQGAVLLQRRDRDDRGLEWRLAHFQTSAGSIG